VEIATNEKYSTRLRAEAIVGLTPEKEAIRACLVRLSQSAHAEVRAEALRSLVGAELTADERRGLEQASSDAATRELVQRVLKLDSALKRPAAEDLAGWMKTLDGAAVGGKGDPAAGERVFFHHAAAGCARCHQMFGRGARVGPELTAAGARLSRERLVESIVRPGKEIAPHFATWLVVTSEGQTLTGMLVKEEATGEQTYADAEGRQIRLAAGQIEQRKPLATSIMPERLGERLTLQEIRDLLAYLQVSVDSE
jgi:putative heme-binding domain-containing protein